LIILQSQCSCKNHVPVSLLAKNLNIWHNHHFQGFHIIYLSLWQNMCPTHNAYHNINVFVIANCIDTNTKWACLQLHIITRSCKHLHITKNNKIAMKISHHHKKWFTNIENFHVWLHPWTWYLALQSKLIQFHKHFQI
jgi:hypothetical protein